MMINQFFSTRAWISKIIGSLTIAMLLTSLMAPLALAQEVPPGEGNAPITEETHTNASEKSDKKEEQEPQTPVPSTDDETGTDEVDDTTPPTFLEKAGDAINSFFHIPESRPGVLTVCKVFVDKDGHIVPVPPGASFSLETSVGNFEFDSSAYNTDLFDDDGTEGNDAYCEQIADDITTLPPTNVTYGEESIDGDEWETPLYNDKVEPSDNFKLNDFHPYEKGGNPAADGSILITNGVSHRTLVILNQKKADTSDKDQVVIRGYKYLKDGEKVSLIPNDTENGPLFHMWATWDAANKGHDKGGYELGNTYGWWKGNSVKYGYIGDPMDVPADFSTYEITDTEEGSTLPIGAECVPGKYRLVGYKTGTTLSAAEAAAITTEAPNFVDVNTDQYFIVVNEKCGTPDQEIENSCALPNSLSDTTEEEVMPSSEGTNLQDILNAKGYAGVDAQNDQLQYQVWDVQPGQEVTVTATFLDEYAGYGNVFGYYKNGNLSTFTPLFRNGDAAGYEALPEATSGDDFDFTIPQNSVSTIGFAIKSYDGSLAAIVATQNSLNTGGKDQVLVYNPAHNTYVLAFEDKVEGSDHDFNDLVVDVVIDCVKGPDEATVTMCKTDNAQQPNALSGWTLMLKGENVQTGLSVSSMLSGGVNSNALTSGVSYIASVVGTWLNQGGANQVDAEYSSTDNWASAPMDGYTGYTPNILELQINENPSFGNWGAYNSAHTYAQSFIQGVNGPANFRIYDGSDDINQNESWFADNSGSLMVDINKGYAGITGENGCVSFSGVPYGTYTVGEIMQDGWKNVSGLGTVTVDSPEETFTVINHHTRGPVENSCALPNSLSDETEEAINTISGETTLQDILIAKGYAGIDAQNDQLQYQVWDVQPGQEVTVTATFLDEYAGYGNVFGYYKNGNLSTFTPLFRNGDAPGYESLDEATSGEEYNFTVPENSVSTIGFAVKSHDGAITAFVATQNSLNTGGKDQVLVYNPSTNTYVLAFEDTLGDGSDRDFNDLVVDVVIDCEEGGHKENTPPVANAGVDQVINLPTTNGTLDGSASTDADGTISTYVWTQVSGPTVIDPADTVTPNIMGLIAGTYVFSLTVTDNDGAIDTDTVSITVLPKSSACTINGEASFDLYSDTDTKVTKIDVDGTVTSPNANAVLVAPNAGNTQSFGYVSIDGPAKWIWSEDPVQDWKVTKKVTFEEQFTISGTPADAMLYIAADDVYNLSVNGSFIKTGGGSYTPTETVVIPADKLVNGTNTITITVTNNAMPYDGSGINNPGGLIYKLHVETCEGGNGGEEPTNTSETIVVKAADLAPDFAGVFANPTKWFFYNDESGSEGIDNALGSFVTGPGTAPIGNGSAQMSVTGSQRRNIATYQFKDVKLADITSLSFATYAQSVGDGSPGTERAPYLHFNVDFNNSDSWQKRLVYVPAVNGVVTADTWQMWNATGSALWTWSGYVANGNKWPDNNTNEYRSWDDIVAAFPNIQTRSTDSWFGFRVGEPYANGFTGNVDKFVIGIKTGLNTHTKTFDFEPTPAAPSPACSDGEDNDGDQLIDAADPGCHSDGNAQNAESYVSSDNDESNGGNGGDGGGGSTFKKSGKSGSHPNGTGGGVLGDFTGPAVLGDSACGEYITDYIKFGKKNDSANVSRLQTFLNEYLGLHLKVDGIYGMESFKAVKQFQVKYKGDVLTPWVGVTLPEEDGGTGWVYKTTKRWINLIKCPDLKLPMPTLTIDQKDL